MSMFLCNQKNCGNDFSEIRFLLKHLHDFHHIYDNPYLKLNCLCEKVFVTFSGFQRHLKTCIKAKREINTTVSTEAEHVTCQNNNDISDTRNSTFQEHFLSFSKPVTNEIPEPDKTVDFEKSVFDFSSDLYSLKLPVTTINVIMGKVRDLTKIHTEQVKKKVECSDSNLDLDTKIDIIDEVDKLHKHFVKFDSQYKREQHLKKICTLPAVQEIPIEVVQELPSTGKRTTKTRTFTYISIIETLSFLFENKSFREFFFRSYVKEDDVIQDIQDGEYFKQHPLFREEERHFLIQLYFDEFDPCNPLGPKRGIYNLGALYFSLRNLPPFLNSCLNHIFLITLFHADDLKNHQFSEILQPLVDDLKKLEEDGIDVDYPDIPQKNIKGTIASLSFDNLGGNTLLSLVKSFSNCYFCKICKISPNNVNTNFVEDPTLMRTKEDLQEILKELANSNSKDSFFGVKEHCVLNDLNFFNTCECITADIQHDLPEGIFPLTLKLVLGFLIEKKVFTLQELNNKIASFNYGILDRCNKPGLISKNAEGLVLSGNSSQILCLSMYLPLMIGHLIPEEFSEHWNVFLSLLEILDIVMSFKITKSMVSKLNDLVRDHLILFLKCFPDQHLLPKHHFMVHYGTIILKMGPMRYLWCMRYEAKHKYFKELIRRMMNFNNICKSLSERHQKDVIYRLYLKDFHVKFNYSRFSKIKIRNILTYNNLISENLGVDQNCLVKKVKWIKLNSVQYRKDFFLFHGFDEFTRLLFLRIEMLFIYGNECYIVGEVFVADDFVENLHSYSITSTHNFKMCSLKSIPHVFPFEKHFNEGNIAKIFLVPGVILF